MSKVPSSHDRPPDAPPSPEEIQFGRLLALVRFLRGPDGCPWDREQTLESLAPHVIEEAHEAADAIERGDEPAAAEELGDLFFVTMFLLVVAEDEGRFGFTGALGSTWDKLFRRHDHVFGDVQADSAEEAFQSWNRSKARERAEKAERGESAGLLDDVPVKLPALHQAAELQRKAAEIGFDWPRLDGAVGKLEEELAELHAALGEAGLTGADKREAKQRADERVREELGDLLFAAANVARFLGYDPEALGREASRKFRRRFSRVEEARAADPGREWSLEEMDRVWEQTKKD
jgi:MazG family protein